MKPNELQYVQEHVSCRNYAADGPIIQIRTLNRGEFLNFDCNHRPFLGFLLRGTLLWSYDAGDPLRIRAAEMFFIARSETFRSQAEEQVQIVLCYLDTTIALCNEYTIKSLSNYLTFRNPDETPFEPIRLPIGEHLMAELETTQAAMATGLLCFHYQREKRDIFLLMLRGFYSKEDLAELFRPVLGEGFDFKQVIQRLYTPSINVQEMIEQTGLPSTSFNRKFMKSFGVTPRKWLIEKKKKDILRDLMMSDRSLKEIARTYGFSPNYFIEFCRTHLGAPPHELRAHEALFVGQE